MSPPWQDHDHQPTMATAGGGPKAGMLPAGVEPKPWIWVTFTSSALSPSGPAGTMLVLSTPASTYWAGLSPSVGPSLPIELICALYCRSSIRRCIRFIPRSHLSVSVARMA
jgi:hypothetical protein